MEMSTTAIRIGDRSNVAEVRRAARTHAERLEWREGDRGDCEIVATELATNIVKHASEGAVAVTSWAEGDAGVVLVTAIDRGPGMNVERCLEDGYSTAGSAGIGLGAVRRLSSAGFDSTEDGTVIVAELRHPTGAARRAGILEVARASPPLEVGGLVMPMEREAVSGDAWACRRRDGSLAVLVSDGLGHGQAAHEASMRAIREFCEAAWRTPREGLETIHRVLRSTRGAACALALIEPERAIVRFCGVGNISASLVDADETRHLVSQNGILGAMVPRLTEFEYPWSGTASLVLHSDGINSRWHPRRWPGLWRRHPALIAAVLYRDCARGNDDVVAVVVHP